MKYLLSITAICIMIVGLGSPAYAYPSMGSNDCFSCHNGTMAPPVTPPAQPDHTPFGGANADCSMCHADWVLTAPSEPEKPDHTNFGNNCYTCHNGTAAPPVTPPAQPDHTPFGGANADCSTCHADWVLTEPVRDVDGDGYPETEDCNDNDASVYPGADEVCDGIDNNCNGTVDDGIATEATSCGIGECGSTGTLACVNGAMVDSCTAGTPTAEVCDGLDNNCNGTADDGIATEPTSCGIGECGNTGTLACVAGVMVDSCTPGTPTAETLDNLDNDCDGQVDEGFGSDCSPGDPATEISCGTGACAATGLRSCVDGFWEDECIPGTPTDEICDDGIDNDCDGLTDEDCPVDNDHDGYFEDEDCDDNDATIYPGAQEVPYDQIDQDCDGSDLNDVDDDGFPFKDVDGNVVDCNDDDEAINPDATEIIDNDVDENCDGVVEKTEPPVDNDGDGVFEDTDCNDNDDTIYPGADEVPYDGIDQDCDGSDLDDVDMDGFPFKDVDGNVVDCNDDDAAINPDATEIMNNDVDENCDGVVGVDIVEDYDQDGYGEDVDCDDTDETINPGAEEVPYDGIDQDCDGSDLNDVDMDGFPYMDVDGNVVDCNDDDATINPDATEIPGNDVDENCDGEIADDIVDNDADGYPVAEDCNDDDASINPGAEEICDDGKDNDCDGLIDDADTDDCGCATDPGGCGDTTCPGSDMDKGTLTVTCSNVPENVSGIKVVLYPAGTELRPRVAAFTTWLSEGFTIFRPDGAPSRLVSSEDNYSPTVICGGSHLAVVKVFYDGSFRSDVVTTTVDVDGNSTLALDFNVLDLD